MTISDLKSGELIILECISGSRAYGLDTPSSDTDIKGVFLLPKEDFYGLNYVPQVITRLTISCITNYGVSWNCYLKIIRIY